MAQVLSPWIPADFEEPKSPPKLGRKHVLRDFFLVIPNFVWKGISFVGGGIVEPDIPQSEIAATNIYFSGGSLGEEFVTLAQKESGKRSLAKKWRKKW